jgi:hypothetical protein
MRIIMSLFDAIVPCGASLDDATPSKAGSPPEQFVIGARSPETRLWRCAAVRRYSSPAGSTLHHAMPTANAPFPPAPRLAAMRAARRGDSVPSDPQVNPVLQALWRKNIMTHRSIPILISAFGLSSSGSRMMGFPGRFQSS